MKLKLIIFLLLASIGANAQTWGNFSQGLLQRKIVGSDTTWRFVGSGSNGFLSFNPSGGGGTADSTVFRTKNNSYSLAGMQTKLNNYVLGTRNVTAGYGILGGGNLNFDRVFYADSTVVRSWSNSLSLAQLQTRFNAKQNNLTLTTTGSGNATLVGVTLNIPTYTLPIATGSILGGIKAGSGVTIDGAGVLSVSAGGVGTVTSVSAGTGMNFTTITGAGAVNADTTVLATKANTKTLAQLQTAFNTKQNTLTLTTTGGSGAATLVGNTLNIPIYTGGGGGSVTSVTSANSDISVANTTSTPILTLNSGVGNNKILKRDAIGGVPIDTVSRIFSLTPNSMAYGSGNYNFYRYDMSKNITGHYLGMTSNSVTFYPQYSTFPGTITMANLASGVTTPTPTGTEHMMTVDANGLLGHRTIPSSVLTSIGLNMPTGFSVSSSPLTVNGTIGVSFASGYSLPTDASQTNWSTAYGWGNHASAGYTTASNSQNFTNKTGNISQWTNDSGYITSSALSGYTTASNTQTFSNKSGNISQWTNDSGYITSSALSGYQTTSNLSTNTSLGTSNTLYPSQNAVKTYVDAAVSSGGGGGSWGSITGTLSSQTDLNSALTAKAALAGATFTGAVSGTTFTASGGFFDTSDMRLKRLVKTKFSAKNITPITYQFKDDKTGKIHVGYSAQQVRLYMPDAVKADDKGQLSVNYIEVLVQKIAELELRIKKLENEKN